MEQRTTKPIPMPVRKLNPKMTTNRGMLVAQGNAGNKKEKRRKPVPHPAPAPVRVVNTQQVNNLPVEQQKIVSNTSERKIVSSPAAYDAKKMYLEVLNSVSGTILEDEFLTQDEKTDICKFYISEFGLIEEPLKLINIKAEESITNIFKTLKDNFEEISKLRDKVEEDPKIKDTIEVIYSNSKDNSEKLITTINESFLSQEKKYLWYKELVTLSNEYPFGDLPNIIHKAFYIFAASLLKAGFITILKEDFTSVQQE